VCFWLTEYVKHGGEARLFTMLLATPLLGAVSQAHGEIVRPTPTSIAPGGIGVVRRAIEKASQSGSRIAASAAAGRRLRETQ
jgi:hypothetical protein